MTTRTCIKSRKPFLFRFRRWEILKRQNYAKNGLPKFATPLGSNRQISKTQRIILTLNYFQHLLHIHWNGFLLFIPCVSNALRMNGKCVTVVASTGLHFRTFYLLTFAASYDLKETIILIYCFLQGLRGRFPVNKLNLNFMEANQ